MWSTRRGGGGKENASIRQEVRNFTNNQRVPASMETTDEKVSKNTGKKGFASGRGGVKEAGRGIAGNCAG